MPNNQMYSSDTQVFWVCKALLNGRIINHLTEIREVRGWRLAAIIHRLRRDYGWPIDDDYVGPQNVKHYRLKAGTDRTKLRFPRSAQALGQGGAQ